MPLLLYCVAAASSHVEPAIKGVADLAIRHREASCLCAFYSSSETADPWLRLPLHDAALQFHRVLMQFFRSAIIVPFRFPTVLEDEQSLLEHLEAHAVEYNAFLGKFANKVQMDIRVTAAEPDNSDQATGGGFLREKQKRQHALDRAGAELQTHSKKTTEGWIRHDTKDGFRAFAVVDRSRVAAFKQEIAAAQVPEGLRVRISGPWPVSAFLGLPAASDG